MAGRMARFICDRCGMIIPPQAFYVVKMTVYADPSLPATTSDEIEEMDYERRMTELMAQMKNMSAQDLEDSVHWEREFKICRPCQVALLRNPLGAADV
jgi:hypothetical protein